MDKTKGVKRKTEEDITEEKKKQKNKEELRQGSISKVPIKRKISNIYPCLSDESMGIVNQPASTPIITERRGQEMDQRAATDNMLGAVPKIRRHSGESSEIKK